MKESEKIKELFSESKGYIENRIALLKLEAVEELSDNVSVFYAYAIITMFGAFFTFLASLFVGLYVSIRLDDYLIGFGSVVAGYLLILLLLVLFRKSVLIMPIQNRIIRHILHKDA
jgi:ABC-type multidrug transport system fused ATPase/permease subunit